MLPTLLFFLSMWACVDEQPASNNVGDPDYNFRYDVDRPDREIELPDELEEISGLSMSPMGEHILGVQDEEGIVFYIDPENGKIRREIEFWKDGDYEGIEAVGEAVFVVKSSGTLYQIRRIGQPDQRVDKFNYFLDSDYDVEGLGWDSLENRLLIACKAKAGEGEEYRMKKAIYSFNLETLVIEEQPAFLISLQDVHDYLSTSPAIRRLEKLWEFFQPNESEFTFAPSALAVHPFTGEIYIASNAGKLILILGRDGKIRHIEKLDKDIHPQPEGLCFDRKGNLYIANEGKGTDPRIFIYNYRL
ncbi:MAG: SdiA-regulated domain-containing protein [Saprospiraceae bacterium]|nr:SdiA-regulated domain-containing protein [Saprospiraceae bacterium]